MFKNRLAHMLSNTFRWRILLVLDFVLWQFEFVWNFVLGI